MTATIENTTETITNTPEATVTTKTKPAKKAKAVDIREGLPTATKTGTAHKPVWHIDGVQHKFIEPLSKFGLTPEGRKPNLGKRVIAKYVAGTTTAGNPLLFVGVFAIVKTKAEKADEAPEVAVPPEARLANEDGLLPPTVEATVAAALTEVSETPAAVSDVPESVTVS